MEPSSLKIGCFRPFPHAAIRDALLGAKRVVVVEKYLAPGAGGILSRNIREAMRSSGNEMRVDTIIAGLGGRPIPKASLISALKAKPTDETVFLDMNWPAIQRELAREQHRRRSGPTAENILYAINHPVSA